MGKRGGAERRTPDWVERWTGCEGGLGGVEWVDPWLPGFINSLNYPREAPGGYYEELNECVQQCVDSLLHHRLRAVTRWLNNCAVI